MSRNKNRYGDYCEIRGQEIYGRVSIPTGKGTYQLKRKKVSSKIEARQWALQEMENAKIEHDVELETFGDLADWYKRNYLVTPVYEDGIKVSGVKDWKRLSEKLDRMSSLLWSKKLSNFNEHVLHTYAKTRREKDKVTTTTLNRDFALMRTAFRRAREIDKDIPLLKFPINLSVEVERDRVMSRDEEKRLLSVCTEVEDLEYKRKGKKVKATGHPAKREHLRPIVVLAVDTALRTKELLTLDWSDVDMTARILNIQATNTKTQRARKIGMTTRVYAELLKLQPAKSGPVFGVACVKKAFKTACSRVGIKDMRFHDLRHTATTRMIRAGVPHTEVMKVTGHTQMKTFMRYLNLEDTTVQNAAAKLDQYNEGG